MLTLPVDAVLESVIILRPSVVFDIDAPLHNRVLSRTTRSHESMPQFDFRCRRLPQTTPMLPGTIVSPLEDDVVATGCLQVAARQVGDNIRNETFGRYRGLFARIPQPTLLGQNENEHSQGIDHNAGQ